MSNPTLDPTSVRRWKRFSDYCELPLDWKLSVPSHWRICRLKEVASVRPSNVDKKSADDERAVRLCNYVDVYKNDRITPDMEFMAATATAAQIAQFSVRGGDVLITKDSETWDDIAVPSYVPEAVDGLVCGYHLALIRPDQRHLDGAYLARCFAAEGLNDQFRIAANGITRYGLVTQSIKEAIFPVPPMNEQRAISSFINRETARIDELIERKERLIALLEEKRGAVINHAVTRGLDPETPLKNSGVPWFGEVPKHWTVLRVRDVARRIQTGTTPPTSELQYYDEPQIPWYGPGSFRDSLTLSSPTRYLSQKAIEDGAARMFEAHSTLIITIGATIGKVGLIETAASSNQQITAVSFNTRRVDPRFAAYQLKRLEPVLRGLAPNTTLPIMSQAEVGEIPFVLPPLSEQCALVERFEWETSRANRLAARIRDGIARLQEYRTALIYAAVTGQIDVRGEVTP